MDQNPVDFNRFFKRSGTRSQTEIKATPVILICVYNHNNTLITHDLIYNIFSKYGKILRILMFEKVKVWKAFVEYSTLESAFEAKRRLDNFVLFNDGTRLNVYFSNLDTIRFRNDNSGGIDYTQQEETETCDTSQGFQSPPRFPSGLLPRNGQPQINEPIIKNNGFPIEVVKQDYPISNSPPFTDEKGEDEILKIINQQQQQHEEKEFFPKEEQQKPLPENPENTGFNPYFLKAFEPQPPQPIITQPQVFPKQSPSRTYEDSEGFQRPVIVRHQHHKHTAPPGLAIYQNNRAQGGFIPTNPDQRTILPSPGSFNSIPTNYPPNNPLVRPSSIQEIPRNMLNTTAPQFDPNQQRPRPSNFSTFSPMRVDQSSPSKVTQPNFGMHVRIGSQEAPNYDPNEGSPDSFSYHNLFDMIERDIANDMTTKMGNMDLNGGHQGYNQPQEVNMGYGYPNEQQQPYMGSNPGSMQIHSAQSFPDANEDKQSQVLFVQGLEDPNITIHMIYNLFGNFGNILKVIFLRAKAATLLEYENIDYATIAKDYLNNIILLGRPLRIFFSNMAIVNLKLKKINKDSGEEVLIGNPKTFRFKKNKNISINPPSATLHLSNLVQEVCNEEAITRFFGRYGTVLAIQPIVKEGKYMCLMKLASIEESINIMAILNDAEFGGGKRVQLSFTRSKI